MPRRIDRSSPVASTSGVWAQRLGAVTAAVALLLPVLAQAYCDDPADARNPARPVLPDREAFSASELFDGPAAGNGLEQLASLAREAVGASIDARGAEHTRRASAFDLQQTQASGKPQIDLNTSAGIGQSSIGGVTQRAGGVGSLGVNASAPLYDGGKLDQLTDYRRRLLDASDNGSVASRERAVREAVLAVIDRNRYRLQLKVYQQQVTKLACLASSIEQIVRQDRGRASELVQARKSQRQVEISRDEAQAALRQVDAQLRRIVGDNVAPWGAVGVPLIELPALNSVLEEINQSADVRQLKLQADAQDSLARATAADRSPQVRWQVGANTGRSAQVTTHAWNAGVALSYTLDDGGTVAAATSAARERAEAARRALESAINERVKQVSTLHDAARSAFLRARRYAGVLQDSDQLRNSTYEQWSKLGRRSLFDLISAETEHYQLRIAYVNALHDGFGASAQLRNAGAGLLPWVAPELAVGQPR
ncbi:Outer membrane protein-like protein [Leptothrix cholodnii SP-6]|uniref:Outer membrane protein-like protein n=1 Tax=Leptothrix cholodnii (strain ATCC 51168 / LMG 8142 / SP-6) TaxID=395495 RepID=B1XZ10_LEPCP|nr:TolC family protein [Leptothrix cholodnii]ACB34029.1 Outer membrane protein-like protein [Leptothrix cholodnii SP-6]